MKLKVSVTAFILAVISALALAGCGAAENPPTAGDGGDKGTEIVQIPNPWREFDSLEAAEEYVGFELNAPESIDGCAQTLYQAMDGMLEVVYENDEGRRVVLRKAVGNGDISGDYSVYSEKACLEAGDIEVAVRGDDGMINLAIWSAADCAYSLSAHRLNEYEQLPGGGLESDLVAELVSYIMEG